MKARSLFGGVLFMAALVCPEVRAAEPAMLILERIEVRTVNANGKPWDGSGGAPI